MASNVKSDSVHGKALSVYRRINNIKRAVSNIDEQRVKIAEKQAIAMDEAQNIAMRAKSINSIKNLAVRGIAGGGVATGLLDENTGSAIAGIGSAAIDVIANASNQNKLSQYRDDMTSNQYAQARDNVRTDIATDAIGGINTVKMLADAKRTSDRDKFFKNSSYTEEQKKFLMANMKEEDWKMIDNDKSFKERFGSWNPAKWDLNFKNSELQESSVLDRFNQMFDDMGIEEKSKYDEDKNDYLGINEAPKASMYLGIKGK